MLAREGGRKGGREREERWENEGGRYGVGEWRVGGMEGERWR